MKNRIFEVLVGFFVVIIAVVFVIHFAKVAVKSKSSSYIIKANFGNIGSLIEGSMVSINGVKVGKVVDVRIDNNTYLVLVTMAIDNKIKLDKNSKAIIQAASFFDSPDIVIIPSNGKDYLKNNDYLWNSSDYVSIEDKIGSIFIGQ